jgi:hypothetical protein
MDLEQFLNLSSALLGALIGGGAAIGAQWLSHKQSLDQEGQRTFAQKMERVHVLLQEVYDQTAARMTNLNLLWDDPEAFAQKYPRPSVQMSEIKMLVNFYAPSEEKAVSGKVSAPYYAINDAIDACLKDRGEAARAAAEAAVRDSAGEFAETNKWLKLRVAELVGQHTNFPRSV